MEDQDDDNDKDHGGQGDGDRDQRVLKDQDRGERDQVKFIQAHQIPKNTRP